MNYNQKSEQDAVAYIDFRPLRTVECRAAPFCACGEEKRYVGVCEFQSQPEPGDFTMCPNCYMIFRICEDMALEIPPQREIPLEYLRARDLCIGESRPDVAIS